MTSARSASPCFTRPMFELGLSSRAPQVSAKRVRLPSSSRGSYRQCVTMYSTLACPRHTCRHYPCTHNAWCLRRLGPGLSSCCLAAASVFKVEQRLFERCETDHCVVTCANSVPEANSTITSSLVRSPLAPLGEHMSFNMNDCSSVSAQQHAVTTSVRRQMATAALVPSEDDVNASFRLRHVWRVCPHTAVTRRRRFTGTVFTRPALDFHHGKSVAALSGSSRETFQLPATL